MGDVIEFRPLARRTQPRRPEVEPGGECRILFFTGVRYERHPEPEAEAPASRSRTGVKPRIGPKRGRKRA